MKIIIEHMKKTILLSFEQLCRRKKKSAWESTKDTKLSETVIRLGLLQFGIKSHNTLSTEMSSEMPQRVQKQ